MQRHAAARQLQQDAGLKALHWKSPHLLMDQHAAADILCHAGHCAIVKCPIPQLQVHGGLPCACWSQEEDYVPLASRKQDAQEACRHNAAVQTLQSAVACCVF